MGNYSRQSRYIKLYHILDLGRGSSRGDFPENRVHVGKEGVRLCAMEAEVPRKGAEGPRPMCDEVLAVDQKF